MSEADRIRRISVGVASGKKKKEEAEFRKRRAEVLQQRRAARQWFKKDGAAMYLKKIKEAAEKGRRSLSIGIAGYDSSEDKMHGNDLNDPYPHEILVLLERLLIKEGFECKRSSQQIGWNALYECSAGPTHGGLEVKW